jgi:hypothetical protein
MQRKHFQPQVCEGTAGVGKPVVACRESIFSRKFAKARQVSENRSSHAEKAFFSRKFAKARQVSENRSGSQSETGTTPIRIAYCPVLPPYAVVRRHLLLVVPASAGLKGGTK